MAKTLIGNIKGPKGDTGETGATGATGAAGASASVSVGTVTALEYGNNPTVTNSGSAQNAVFNFGIPKGKPADNITELDNLPVNSSVTPSADFPVPAVGDTSKTILGKIIKWFGDMSALVATKFNAANVVNNLTTTESGYALDARQGKILDDRISGLITQEVRTFTTNQNGYVPGANYGLTPYNMIAVSIINKTENMTVDLYTYNKNIYIRPRDPGSWQNYPNTSFDMLVTLIHLT